MDLVNYELIDDVAVLTIDNPPSNALSAAVRTDLRDAFRLLREDGAARAAVLIGANGRFAPGADITEFGTPTTAPGINAVVTEMHAAGKPVIAAIERHALGGGFELALGAHFRVIAGGATVGLPEVNIGLLPGGGGTQRLPRLAGPAKAIELMLSGKHVDAAEALKAGLVDQIAEDRLLEAAVALARSVVREGRPFPTVDERSERLKEVDHAFFTELRKNSARKWRGLLAPSLIVDCVEAAVFMPPPQARALEAGNFQRCVASPQREALIHLFKAERAAARIPGLDGVAPRDVRTAAVVGAGTMGRGIAMACANAGMCVVLIDADPAALHRATHAIGLDYNQSVSRGKVGAAAAEVAQSLISTSLDAESAASADIVIEAVFEDLPVKQQVARMFDSIMRPDAIFATNTSTMDIERIARATSRPERVVGTHFFSPAHVMKLQENVQASDTHAEVLATVMTFAKKLGKVAVLAQNRDGFIGNRILGAYGRECDFLLEEGATPWQIDKALQAFGFPMGMYLMRDMAGLDVSWKVRQYREQFRDKSLRYSVVADRICALGRFGQKTGAGYYVYSGRAPHLQPMPDAEVENLIRGVAEESGIERRAVSDEEIVERVLCAMVNEGAKVVEEGVAFRASDIDVVYVHGYGFPRHEGGPMFWAQRKGLREVLENVLRLEAAHGRIWAPAGELVRAAERGAWAT